MSTPVLTALSVIVIGLPIAAAGLMYVAVEHSGVRELVATSIGVVAWIAAVFLWVLVHSWMYEVRPEWFDWDNGGFMYADCLGGVATLAGSAMLLANTVD